MDKEIVLTFDVEDWFNVLNMKKHFPYGQWRKDLIRLQHGVDFILFELSKRRIRATFFILGWLADNAPEVIKKIQQEGHEIATHGYNHQSLLHMSKNEFRNDLDRSIQRIKHACGVEPTGYRAPSFSITYQNFWALDVIKDLGLSYDSSIFPVAHPDYGIPGFIPKVQKINGLIEVPIIGPKIGKRTLPITGGGYFHLLPYTLTRTALSRALKNQHVIMYFHPWEFDPDQPRIPLPAFKKFRHYVGLKKNRAKFTSLLDDFKFISMDEFIQRSFQSPSTGANLMQ